MIQSCQRARGLWQRIDSELAIDIAVCSMYVILLPNRLYVDFGPDEGKYLEGFSVNVYLIPIALGLQEYNELNKKKLETSPLAQNGP